MFRCINLFWCILQRNRFRSIESHTGTDSDPVLLYPTMKQKMLITVQK
jgi:hypothetical protein